MKFTITRVVVALLPLLAAATVEAAPAGSYEVASRLQSREPAEYIYEEFEARAKKLPAPGPHANIVHNIQTQQVAKHTMKEKKAAANAKVTKPFKKPVHDKSKKTPADKVADKKRGQALNKARQDHKAKNKAWLDKNKKTPEEKAVTKAAKAQRRQDRKAGKTPTPAEPNKQRTKKNGPPKPKERLTADQKKAANAQFADARTKLKNTQNLPGRKDTYSVGKTTVTGKDVRQGIFNTHLHKNRPIGNAANKNPKVFENRPFAADHKDKTLAGKKPIQGNDGTIHEYPLKAAHQGHINGPVGAARVMTYESKGKPTFKVFGHDSCRGTDPCDHYEATHKKAKRELAEDFEDFE